MVSEFVLGEKMAGPGIRNYHLSRILGHYTDLTLAILPQDRQALAAIQKKLPGVNVIRYRLGEWDSLKDAARLAEVIILQPFAVDRLPQFLDEPAAIVLDGYDPLLAEWLTTIGTEVGDEQIARWSSYMAMLYNQYQAADFIICASERQRFWWLGQLELAGRINPLTYHEDPSLRNLVDVVPYGLPEKPPRFTKQMIKGVWPGINQDDVVLLWGGGLWPWLDPITAIRAVQRLSQKYPKLKLIFPGTKHPNQNVARTLQGAKVGAFQYARENNLLDHKVFFGEWVPYNDWQNVLLESDIALSLHYDTLETQLAFRSRLLEYIWAGIPVIATTNDATSDMVNQYNLGRVVGFQAVDEVVQAIEDILADKDSYQQGFEQARQELTWENTTKPLVRFCQNPKRAADRDGRDRLGITHHDRRRIELEALVMAYRSGRLMRIMSRIHDLRVRLEYWRDRL